MSEEEASRVVARAGTDGSYDLVVLVVTPRPEGTVVWRGDAGVPPRRKDELARAVLAQFGAECEARGVGLTLCFYQRLPDPFVITARVKAALRAKEP